jgi:hypothetical protein
VRELCRAAEDDVVREAGAEERADDGATENVTLQLVLALCTGYVRRMDRTSCPTYLVERIAITLGQIVCEVVLMRRVSSGRSD